MVHSRDGAVCGQIQGMYGGPCLVSIYSDGSIYSKDRAVEGGATSLSPSCTESHNFLPFSTLLSMPSSGPPCRVKRTQCQGSLQHMRDLHTFRRPSVQSCRTPQQRVTFVPKESSVQTFRYRFDELTNHILSAHSERGIRECKGGMGLTGSRALISDLGFPSSLFFPPIEFPSSQQQVLKSQL